MAATTTSPLLFLVAADLDQFGLVDRTLGRGTMMITFLCGFLAILLAISRLGHSDIGDNAMK